MLSLQLYLFHFHTMIVLKKNNVLLRLADLLTENKPEILLKNELDMNSFSDMDESMKDRLKVDERKVEGMIRSLCEVAAQDDPEGKILYDFTREDGLHIVNRTVPFGAILIIYESRPDVTIEAAATAFKAGNRILLKGGKESFNTNTYLTELWQQSLSENGFEKDFVQYLNLSREETQKLIKQNTYNVDIIIPRGGNNLINFVTENSSVPVIVSGRGNNFMYVDDDCDTDMAIRLIINGKKRISVCNALDKVLVNKNLPKLSDKISDFVSQLKSKEIVVWGDKKAVSASKGLTEINDEAVLFEEFMAPKIYFSLVDDMNEAIEKINHYSGGHSAVIVTNDAKKANVFMQKVDCAAVYHNASTRFTDGGQFGVGGEIAISTQKLHFRGPLSAQELVTNKWFVYGKGQIRE
ncbi:MAG: Gamma-glutamyl phosphate reductase [Bacteroidetes bacterium ADurb.BinA174]|nr:MAG: Gamma-glutamyl phosphate reductase [Bacteroidetes bacterium ADurb.BinA174]